MRFTPKTGWLLLLAGTAVVCSRAVFALFHDPEGPNLLVVVGLAVVLYVPSAAAYTSKMLSALRGTQRGATAILIQIVIAAVLYFGVR